MRRVFMGLFLGVLCAPMAWAQQPVLVAENGVAQATIVVAADAPPSVAYAAEELQRFLSEMGGVEIPKVNDAAAVATPNLIDVGNVTGRLAVPDAAFGIEDYHLATVGNALVIDGGKQRGVLYGAYGLLEDHLGCRWYTTEVSRIPTSTRLEIPTLDERVKPVLEYREPFVMDCYDGDWSARNRMNGTRATLEAKHGDKVRYVGFVHTFNELVPPEKYFAEHPEYFALVDGKRLGERTQLCCTNPDVINIITEGIRQRMRDNPDAMVFSISQNDWFNYCTCDKCAALAEQEESQIAPVLALVNHVAREVRGEFPDKAIDTLAYQWTRQPPKHMRPEPNVIVRFCSIECCFAHPFDQCEGKANKQFVKDAQGWKAVGARLWVWDYVTSFSHYLVPFPNLHVRKPNIQFFIDHGVTGIFEQDVYQTPHGEFSELSGYLNAKLLWNPKGDTDVIINEFLDAVYGPGAPYLRQYLDAIHEKVKGRNAHMGIWVGPEAKHLDDAVLAEADRLFDAAEASAANEPAFLERIKIARLSADYAIIERARNKQGNLYEVDHANFTVRIQPAFDARVKRFFEVAERCGFSTIREHMGELAGYKATFASMDQGRTLTPRDAVAVEHPKRGLHYAYYEGAFDALPDFAALTPVREGVAGNIGLRPGIKADGIALKFSGYFHAPKDGIYTFTTSSNDGSQLYLGEELVVDNGGLHKLETKSGVIALRAGYHALRVTYFESGGEEGLEVSVEGPDMGQRKIPARLLSH